MMINTALTNLDACTRYEAIFDRILATSAEKLTIMPDFVTPTFTSSINYVMPTLMTIAVIASSGVAIILFAALWAQRDHRLANRLLAGAILLSLSNNILLVLKAWDVLFSVTLLIRLNFPLFLLCNALLYFYFRLVTQPSQVISYSDTWHLAPFALGLMWYFMVLGLGGEDLFADTIHYRWEHFGREVIGAIVSAFYVLGCYRLLSRFKRRLPDIVSRQDEISGLWLKLIFASSLLIWILTFLNVISGPHIDLLQGKPIALLICISTIAYFAIAHSAVFREVKKVDENVNANANANEKTPSLSEERLQKCVHELNRLFLEQRPYLDPNLRLSSLAALMHLKPYQMSEVLGRGLGTNFFEYVNQHRVEEAKRRLLEPSQAHLSILGIAMDSGFNSKSAFADAFKRWTGTTPSVYRTKPPCDRPSGA